jgi:hypothetical protein
MIPTSTWERPNCAHGWNEIRVVGYKHQCVGHTLYGVSKHLNCEGNIGLFFLPYVSSLVRIDSKRRMHE